MAMPNKTDWLKDFNEKQKNHSVKPYGGQSLIQIELTIVVNWIKIERVHDCI